MNKSVFLSILGFLLAVPFHVLPQCAMCRATVENNVSGGETALAVGLNTGIIYLFIAPYLLIAAVIFFWYRKARLKKSSFTP